MPCDFYQLPHPGIQSLAPYIPGKSADALRREKGIPSIIKLASNENPLGCSPLAVTALQQLSPTEIAAYCISAIHPIHDQLADLHGIPKEMIILGNGSDLLFTLLLTCFALHTQKHMLIPELAFISYQIQAQTLGIPVHFAPLQTNWQVDIDALINDCNKQTGLIFLANPNNPTGTLLATTAIEKLLQNIPDSTLLVLDEAYYEYLPPEAQPETIPLLAHYPNLVITRTFSKIYGLAGLRLGYALACKPIMDILHRAQLPFTVNKAVLEAASAALTDTSFLQKSVANNRAGLAQLTKGLSELGFSYLPPAGNFITFDCKKDTSRLYQALLEHGIIIRPLQPYGLHTYFRVTVGTEEQNEQFLKIFKEIYNE